MREFRRERRKEITRRGFIAGGILVAVGVWHASPVTVTAGEVLYGTGMGATMFNDTRYTFFAL